MTDFVLVPSRQPDAIRRITELAAFRASRSFRLLDAEDIALAYVVAGAFGQFLADAATSPRDVADAVRILEELAGWDDPETNNHLMVGVIESIDPDHLARLRPLVGERLGLLIGDVERFWAGA